MIERHEKLFLDGARQNNLDLKKTKMLFKLIFAYGGYSFNKSHAVAYALIAYQAAYLKANYQQEFCDAFQEVIEEKN